MAITYNNGIPVSGNDPSDDQPLMLQNTQAIKNIWGVDHYDFDSASPAAGTHKWVRLNANPTVTPGANVHTLFTANVSGTPQLFWYSDVTAKSAAQYVDAAEGSTFLFGGMILKWGLKSVGTTSAVINFGVSFPNDCYSVIVTHASTLGANRNISVSNLGPSGFTAVASAAGTPFYYVAIGK